MLDLLADLMAAAHERCAYADVRHVARREERILARDGRADRADTSVARGVGVRVRVGGAWGFAATADVSKAGAEAALGRALALAQALPAVPGAAHAALEATALGHWTSPGKLDPFAVSQEEKLGLLLAAEAALRGDPRITRTEASCLRGDRRVRRRDPGMGRRRRRRPGALLSQRARRQRGPGRVGALLSLDLAGHAPRIAEEAVALLTAPTCPSGRTTLILSPEQLALQVHESIGHALELDRILLGEASYAGTRWVQAGDLGSLRYGSEHLHITADGTAPGGLGTYGWDDEGVAAARTPLIEGGVLRAALSDRQSAAAVGLDRSAGCARADGFARQPIVRMTNVSIEPGEAGSLDDLLADTGEGVYLETNRSWSIDDLRLNFQFATEVPTRSATGGWAGCCATRPTPASRRASGPGWTRCAQRPRGVCTACSTAARASPGRSCGSPTAPRRRAFATSRSA